MVICTLGCPFVAAPESVTNCPYTIVAIDALIVTASPVVNETSGPLVVPALLNATRRKWYVVCATRPVIGALTTVVFALAARDFFVVSDPYDVVVPYWKYQSVARP